ncbi:MAG TPA: glutamine--fructose-6-phosphate transaminase (isomerizing) [Ruminococcaceae bacterium]|nr:glutamine--fructose-6-phosphate transaminase (isomerizing) [Oscillospiraceae bacterium]
MCGIVGYIGDNNASPILLDGLKKLEYRGYDSAGIAVYGDSGVKICKTKGRIADLEGKLGEEGKLDGCVGIGHTRWATHGAPDDINAHPHKGGNGRITLVHNGIIENYIELKIMLEQKGYVFVSQTDTEVLAHLFDYFYEGDSLEAMSNVMKTVRGSYATAVLIDDKPNEIIAARKDSPLIVGIGEGENFLASDIPAVLKYTRDCYLLDDNQIAVLTKDSIKLYDINKNEVHKDVYHVTWDVEAAEKGGFDHFMKKEIAEQPRTVHDTLAPRIKDGKVVIDELSLTDEQIKNIGTVHIVACGSAWHVGMAARYVIEKLAKTPCEVDLASEFRYRNPIVRPNDICIVISQSGETADTLAALREAKRKGARTISIVNVVASTIARESDDVIYTMAGPEIAVATTKAFSAQLNVAYLLAIRFAKAKGLIGENYEKTLCEEMLRLPEIIEKLLEMDDYLKELAKKYVNSENVFFIGRGLDYAISLEGSLKLKEISYIHSEAYAAGELKHGTISLIEEGTPVFQVATQPDLLEKTLGNIKEVKARGARVVALVGENHTAADEFADDVIRVPEISDILMPSLTVIPLQIFAYYMALGRGCDVDKPRNLAKSVTVE